MADRISPKQRSRNMSRIKSQGMKPEMAVRKMVHGMGYRYRLHRTDLPGKPDLVFGPKRKIIFVHGCFWHQHDDIDCRRSHAPKSNKNYWSPKLAKNVARDRNSIQTLEELGWTVLVVWECEIDDLEKLKSRLFNFLDDC